MRKCYGKKMKDDTVHFLLDEKTNQKNHPLIKKILKFF